jgi:hypothetical protein
MTPKRDSLQERRNTRINREKHGIEAMEKWCSAFSNKTIADWVALSKHGSPFLESREGLAWTDDTARGHWCHQYEEE